MKILMLDIETAPIQCWVWSLRDPIITPDQIIEPSGVLCWAAKWYGEKGIRWGKSISTIHALLSSADAVCTYNGKSFDSPVLNREFVKIGLPPLPPVPHIDLWRTVTRNFRMDSSKLAFVAPYLGIGEKVKNAGWALWLACLKGDPKAWADMRRYNEMDVILLEKLYNKLLPWIDNHPNQNLMEDSDVPVCPNCKSDKLERRGYQRTVTQEYIRFQCKGCGRWSRSRTCVKRANSVRVR